jgi:hypothetical protein
MMQKEQTACSILSLCVEAGTQQADEDLRLPLNPEDVAWLHDHQGRCQMCVPASSTHHKAKVASAQMKGKLAAEIPHHRLAKNHQVVGAEALELETANSHWNHPSGTCGTSLP